MRSCYYSTHHSSAYFWKCVLFTKKRFIMCYFWNFFICLTFRLANTSLNTVSYSSLYMLYGLPDEMWDIGNVVFYGSGILSTWDVGDVWMLGMWGIGDVRYWGLVILGVCDVRDVRYWRCEMLGMWYVWDVVCLGCMISGCGMFGMWGAQNFGCWGCGMFRM